jgi:hypothetical protein
MKPTNKLKGQQHEQKKGTFTGISLAHTSHFTANLAKTLKRATGCDKSELL